ncbi:MAG: recombinase family protein [Nitrospira sp.]|nr:recombinase family protein [Nitrospira sp.]
MEDRERTLDSPIEKIMLQLQSFADEMERERGQQRTYDAMVRKAKQGHICGGSCYGYRNVEVLDASGRRSHVTRTIDPAEAETIKTIFRLYIAGHGFMSIARTLNAERVHGPLARKSSGWGASAVRTILYRELYNGRLVWGATKKKDRWGARKVRKQPKTTWITTNVPDLKIIDDTTWREAQARLKNVRALYLRATDGRLYGKPAAGYESRYLLCGFTTCAHCGSSICVRSHANGQQARKCFYSCTGFYLRGHAVCSERLRLPIEAVDRAILTALK